MRAKFKKSLGELAQKLQSKNANRYLIILFVVIAGMITLTLAKAAPNTATIEPEDGNLSGVSSSTNSSASGGRVIKFGAPSNPSAGGLNLIFPDSELAQVKQSVTSGSKKAYWDYIKSRWATKVNTAYTPNWSANVTFDGKSFNPKRFVSTEHPDQASVDAQGKFMINASQNAYGCALKWYIDGDQACGTHAVNILDGWSKNLEYIYCRPSGIDVRENQIKLWSEWSVPMFTKSAEILWDHPSFTPAMKTQFASWMWKSFLLQNASLQESDGEILGMSAVGWNGRMSSLHSRLFAGLAMKAAGHPEGNNVINDSISKLENRLPEVLYYGKQPWHEVLGQGWPKQPYRHKNTTYSNWHTASGMKSYWFIKTNAPSPPPYFIGQTQETGRDVGHTQMGIGSLSEMLKAMRLNGYSDRFAKSDLGDVMVQLGEVHAKSYNEALDAYWASPSNFVHGGSSSIEGLSCGWKPSGWDSLQVNPVSPSSNCPSGTPSTVTFKIAGASADHGWELIRAELKRSGYSTPQLDKITSRLRGTGSRSSTNSAGFSTVDLANHMGWEPLFSLDY